MCGKYRLPSYVPGTRNRLLPVLRKHKPKKEGPTEQPLPNPPLVVLEERKALWKVGMSAGRGVSEVPGWCQGRGQARAIERAFCVG